MDKTIRIDATRFAPPLTKELKADDTISDTQDRPRLEDRTERLLGMTCPWPGTESFLFPDGQSALTETLKAVKTSTASKILVQEPVMGLDRDFFESNGLTPEYIAPPTNGSAVDVSTVIDRLSDPDVCAVLLTSPRCPDGAVVSAADLKRIADASGKPLIVDYHFLSVNPNGVHIPLALDVSTSRRGDVFEILDSSLIVSDDPLIKRAAAVVTRPHHSAAAAAIRAASDAFVQETDESTLERILDVLVNANFTNYRSNWSEGVAERNRILLSRLQSQIRLANPPGYAGPVLLLDLRGVRGNPTDEQFADALLKRGVKVIRGSKFLQNTQSEAADLFGHSVVVSVAALDNKQAQDLGATINVATIEFDPDAQIGRLRYDAERHVLRFTRGEELGPSR